MDLTSISRMLIFCIFVNVICEIDAIKVKFEDVDVLYINGEFVDEKFFDVSVNHINDTYNTLRCKAVVLKKFPEDSRVLFKGYGYAFGKYRMPMGMSIDISICDVKSKPILIAPFITAIGGDLDKCGPDVGEYGNDSFYPVNLDMLPSVFPPNKYRVDIEVGNQATTIVKVQFYISVD